MRAGWTPTAAGYQRQWGETLLTLRRMGNAGGWWLTGIGDQSIYAGVTLSEALSKAAVVAEEHLGWPS